MTEEVYMRQPPGFIHPQFPNHVCHLRKAIYGLKQAPRAWLYRFSSFLLSRGFICSKSDNSLFIYRHGSSVFYLLLYVDDIIITGNSPSFIYSFISCLGRYFAMKDLGDLHFSLGVQAVRLSKGLFLSQQKYVSDLLARFHLHTLKHVRTPLPSRTKLSLTDGELLADPTKYRSMRIFRYLQGTSAHGLLLQPDRSSPTVNAYSDADWAGCPDSSWSTSGFAIFLGPNLFSWKSKKQPTVSRSSTEAEYRAIAYTVQDTLHIRSILFELGVPIRTPVRLLCDNVSASYLSTNPIQHARSKHISIDYLLFENVSHMEI
ncbi:unnamed protein product [Cuscuta epithymum]|uniref:Reverse transcriptase Ty1/copia-type domain-containing protein n=1 Tax=Cuscuta epithymum TaxID=186058 RepID=A0AAV0CEH4_9ASTE|nr:unnamed protein product [Cuscuta epithymum]